MNVFFFPDPFDLMVFIRQFRDIMDFVAGFKHGFEIIVWFSVCGYQ